ncbi:transmembrane channel-like protein 5 isoform X2 [Rhopilema esculentum]|uniref:transmembrane channel-like protein 5 isoform X2 n=1 Tax=Rhopilema esculentum TaxID=499914 RepID=UPI0031D90C29
MDVQMKSYEKQTTINVAAITDAEHQTESTSNSSTRSLPRTKIISNTPESSLAVKQNQSGVRLFMRHLNRQRRNVHPEEGRLSPQLIIRNGEYEIFDPEDTLQKKDTKMSFHKKKYWSEFNNRSGSCFASIKRRMDFLRFKYGDLVPFLRKHIKRIEGGYGSGVAAVFKFTRWAILLNVMLSLIWVGFLVTPAAIKFDYSSIAHIKFEVSNLFDGKGKLQNTWMFYGSYPSDMNGYRIDYAYIVIGLLTFFGSLLVILKSAVESNTMEYVDPFSKLVLASWDFSVTEKQAVKSVAKGIITQAKDLLSEEHALNMKMSRKRGQKCFIYLRRAFAWTLSGALTAGACVTIYFFLVKVTVAEVIINNTNVQIGRTFLEVYGFSLLFALLNSVLPLIIQALTFIESYESGLHVIYVNVIRIFMLRFLNLFALIFTLYDTITSSSFRGCGGTFIGQEFYKIILLDIAVVTIVQVSSKFGLYLIRGKRKKEPDVSKVVLQIVYRQALIWAGTFFCPVLPLLGILAQCLVFIVNYVIILVTCKAPSKRFKQTEGILFFKGCLIFSLLCLLVPISTVFASKYVMISTLTTSYSNGTIAKMPCGPFGDKPPLQVLEEGKSSLPNWLSILANWITSTAVFPAILIMSIIIYIQRLQFLNERKQFRQLQIDYLEYQKRSNLNLLRRKRDDKV